MNAGRVRAREEELAQDPRVSSPAAGRRAGTGEGAAGTGVSLCLGHSHGNSVVTFLPLKKKKKKKMTVMVVVMHMFGYRLRETLKGCSHPSARGIMS